MRRETQNVLLVLLGGALLKIGITGDYLRYVKPAQLPWLLAGGAVVLLLGAVAIVRDVLAARALPQGEDEAVLGDGAGDGERLGDAQELDDRSGPAHGDGLAPVHGHGDGHGHHHAARAAWLLVLPVLAVFLIAPPALGADSVTRTEARAPAQDKAAFPPLPAGEVVPLTMTQFVARAGWDAYGSLNGRKVLLTGFVTHSKGSTLLARMVITCCAADAYPLTVRLTSPEAARFADDTWLQVTGEVVPGTAKEANRYTPDVTVSTLHRIPQPQDPYED
ncbi:TIGR03943 family protein [Amycolatopsis acidicola]|uniref:TIGR03943 family protein n=1 Tax=Amycolatopsis acidicola TaxID=2596893 RepID=A0A5N0V0A0_9PSEU|nr:TIGR03943 family protein [Amycolatopsis acidicola]KAA9159823.1 TIGR03943 family protein [Amycolatopsis acidicola]